MPWTEKGAGRMDPRRPTGESGNGSGLEAPSSWDKAQSGQGDAFLSGIQEDRQALMDGLYGKHQRRARRIGASAFLTQAAILLLFLGVWEAAGRHKWIDPLLFSYPSKIMKLIGSMAADGSLWPHVGATVGETIAGFALGTLLGIAIAAVLWWFPFLSRVFDPYLVVLNSMPKVALGPIFIVALGPGFLSIVAITLMVTVIITTINIYNRFREIDSGFIKVVRLFGASRAQLFRLVILPGSFPVMIATLKVNVGLAWVGVIVGEFLVAKVGLGYQIIYGFQVFNFTLVLSSLVVIGVVATIMYQLVAVLERKLTEGWRER